MQYTTQLQVYKYDMDKGKVAQYILIYRDFFAKEDIYELKQFLESIDDSSWEKVLKTQLHNPNTIRMVSIFAGPIGIDRFIIGDIALGVLKTITCGGICIWAIIDCFIIYKATQKNNFNRIINTI